MKKLTNAPLLVRAVLASPVVMAPHEGISIDGLLAYAAFLDERGDAAFGPAPDPKVIEQESAIPNPRVPLATDERNSDWVYCASHGVLVGHVGGAQHHVHKRFDDAIALQSNYARDARVIVNSGPLRSHRVPRWAEVAEAIEWSVLGRPAEIERLLRQYVTHVGKQSGNGYGVVAAWETEPLARDDSWLVREDGRPARPIPTSWGTWPGELRNAAIRPPYWIAGHRRECWV
jgi:CRISPR type IV-associated protein Csf3